MFLGIDHLIIAVDDPDTSIELLATALGTATGTAGGRHPGWGTYNRLLWFGDTYIELLGIDDPVLAAGSWLGAPALATLNTGPGPVSWAISSDDLDGDAARLSDSGAPLGQKLPGQRPRPDGEVVRWRLALPPTVSLDQPFLIEHDTNAAEWTPADRAARASRSGRIAGLDLPVDRIAGLGAYPERVALGSQFVRITGAGSRVPTIHIEGTGLTGVSGPILGCRWALG